MTETQEANYHLQLSFWWYEKYYQSQGRLSDSLRRVMLDHAEDHAHLAVYFYSQLSK